MRQSFAILSFLASAAFAQNSTVEFFFPGGYEGTDPVASVVTANPSTTVLNLACPTGTDSTECGFGTPMNCVFNSLILIVLKRFWIRIQDHLHHYLRGFHV